jgi:hypothetical protein
MKKTLILAMIVAVLIIAIPKTQAATNWADYFTKDEAASIKKMVDKYIRGQIDDNEKEWKGVIGNKQVDKSIAKKKIYTGTYPSSISDADVTSCDEEDIDECNYYVKIHISEIDIDKLPQVYIYEEETDEAFGSGVVNPDFVGHLSNEYAFLNYANSDGGEVDFERFGETYRVVVFY